MEIAAVARRFRADGNAERAEGERAYLKSELRFHGVGMPRVRAAAKDLLERHGGRGRGGGRGELSVYCVPALWSAVPMDADC